jgi:catechol 2,3-dioxygenase-like lactoylglutathione lyase family enzyme
MNIWEHLFLTGEFRARDEMLLGLTLEEVTLCPAGMSHSIYEELWHAAMWQRAVLDRNEVAGEDYYPRSAPEQEHQWHDLVLEFMNGANAAVAWAQSSEALAVETAPGTVAAELASLAVHNAYHLGKIVALRQLIGAWPPKGQTDGQIIGSPSELMAQSVVEIVVPDLQLVLGFYRRLGFAVERETPTFVTLRWESVLLFVAQDANATTAPRWTNVRIVVDDVDAIWERVRQLEVPVVSPLGDRPYGLRDFTVRDPAGFEIRFAQVEV